MGLSAGDLAGMRGCVDGFLPDTATNSRTSATLAVYVAPNTRFYTMGAGLRFHSTRIACDWAANVQPGDVLTYSGVGYAVQETSTPRSNATQLDLIAIPTSLSLASIVAPDAATFQHPTDLTKTVAASVAVHTMSNDAQVYGVTPAYPWVIVFENTAQYAGGGSIGDGHRLLLSSLFGTDSQGTPRAGIITKPRPLLHGLPFMVTTVKEVAG